MAERTYKALVGVVHAGQGVRAGKTFKANEDDPAIVQCLAFGLIERAQPTRKASRARPRDRG